MLAAVEQRNGEGLGKGVTYPTAPHDSVSSITRMVGSVLNLSTTDCRSF